MGGGGQNTGNLTVEYINLSGREIATKRLNDHAVLPLTLMQFERKSQLCCGPWLVELVESVQLVELVCQKEANLSNYQTFKSNGQ